MTIGYYVQGDMDEAVVRGLARRWCPAADLAPGRFRGRSRESFRRELEKSLLDLTGDKRCDVVVILTDADANRWREVKEWESRRIPAECEHLAVFGVADRNIECWLAIEKDALAKELECTVQDISVDDPSGFVKRRFGLSDRDSREAGKRRVSDYVAGAQLKSWIEGSESFKNFYRDARALSQRQGCAFPNELENR